MSLYKSTKEITATPITPSNSSPAVITSGGTYTAQANGKAVSIITEVTPSSTPTSVSINDVVRLGGSGVIVDEVKQEQSKSVTATTSVQTVTPDNGKVLSSVTVNPQNHSATYTPTGYSNAKDMGAQHNYRYVDTSGYEPTYIPLNSINDVYRIQEYKTYECTHGASYELNPHIVAGLGSLTPSDSSPQHFYKDAVYQASGEGYAIESQPTSVTPSSTPTSVSSGDIIRVGGSGVVVDSVPPTPTSITPSNSSPVSMSANTAYKPTESGVAIKSYDTMTPSSTSYNVLANEIIKFEGSGAVVDELTSLTPSNISPDTITVGKNYKALTRGVAIYSYSLIEPNMSGLPDELTQDKMYKANVNCYAIRTYNTTTPSNSSPVALSNKSIHRISGTGYAIATLPTSKTPSDIDPPAVYEGGGWYDITGSDGYLYATIQKPQNVACILGSGAGSTSYTHANINPVGSATQFIETDYFDFDDGSGNLTVIKAFSGYLYLYVSSGRNSSGTTIYCYCDVRINGTSDTTLSTNSSNNTRATSKQISLAVGDVISVYSKVNTGSASAYTKWMLTLKTTIQPSSGTA